MATREAINIAANGKPQAKLVPIAEKKDVLDAFSLMTGSCWTPTPSSGGTLADYPIPVIDARS